MDEDEDDVTVDESAVDDEEEEEKAADEDVPDDSVLVVTGISPESMTAGSVMSVGVTPTDGSFVLFPSLVSNELVLLVPEEEEEVGLISVVGGKGGKDNGPTGLDLLLLNNHAIFRCII